MTEGNDVPWPKGPWEVAMQPYPHVRQADGGECVLAIESNGAASHYSGLLYQVEKALATISQADALARGKSLSEANDG